MSYTIADRYIEGTDGQSVVVRLLDAAEELIDGGAINEVIATLESLDDGTVIIDEEDCTPGEVGSRGSVNDDGELVVTFTAADMAASGPRALQGRRLTLKVTHSTDRVWYGEETFLLLNRAAAPFA